MNFNNININFLKDWTAYLNQVSPGNNHPWICEVNRDGGPRKIELLSQTDYNSFFKNHSPTNSSLRKLSLSEIVKISKDLMFVDNGNFYKANVKEATYSDLFNYLDLTKIEDITEEGIKDRLNRIRKLSKALRIIPPALKEVSDRAAEKRLDEKMQTVWGKIKWCIWSWFYDNRVEISRLKNFVPTETGARKVAKEALLHRIILNIDTIEEEMSPGKVKNYADNNDKDKIEKWKKADYEHRILSLHAQEANDRVVKLLEIYEKFEKDDKYLA